MYKDMPCSDPNLVTPKLIIILREKPIKQHLLVFYLNVEVQIKYEI